MNCLTCVDLEKAFESSLVNYSKARSAAFFQVSTELAARKQVDMERARNDLEEHQLICPLAPAGTAEVRSEASNERILVCPAGLV